MALSKKIFPKVAAAAGGVASAEQNLIVHLDANDVDSYDGDGSIWYDISEHDLTVPLSDNADDLELHLNASDSTSYNPTSGTTTWSDISGNSRDATMTSMGNSNFGIDNGGYFDFDGSNDGMTVTGNSAFYPTTTTGITVECWFTSDTTDDGENLVNNQSSTGGYRLWSAQSNLYADTFNSSGTRVGRATSGTVSDNTWHHAVFTLENSTSTATLKLYLDGELVNTDASVGTAIGTTVQNLNIGRRADATYDRLNGKMGAVRIYSKELSASEIGQNYRHGRDYIYTDLVDDTNLELHLDPTSYSGSGSTWTADTGSNGTLVGNISYDQELGDWFDLDGSSDYITVNSSAINSATNFTIEGWFNPDNLTAADHLFAIYGGVSDRKFFLRLTNTSGDLDWQIYNSSGGNAGYFTTSNANARLTANQWNHVAVTHINNGSMEVFVNGVSAGTGTSTGINTTGTEDLYIGVLNTFIGSYDFDGKVGQVRFYSSALSSDEVMQNYLFTQNNYPNTNHGTITGATWNGSGYFDFDGIGDKVNFTDVGLTNSSISYITWINFDSYYSGDGTAIFHLGDGGAAGASLLFREKSSGKLALFTGGTFVTTTSTPLSLDTWHHVALSVSGTAFSIYVDGTFVQTLTADEYNFSGTDRLILCNYGNVPSGSSAQFLNGFVGEVKMYNRSLTGTEITAHYNSTKSTYGV